MADPEDREARPDAPAANSPQSSETGSNDPGASDRAEMWIGVYRVLRLLGRGGMGDVFLAFDARLQRHVAIKRIRSDALVSPRARARLRREATAVAALSHPSVVHVYDILAEESSEAIVMEYVEGETLARAVARAPLTVRQALGIGRQVAEGLAAAHARGLIHRDLKMQNVMLTPSGQAKILDFGLVKHLQPLLDEDSLTGEGSVVGTARSMSPEQAQGREVDERSDLFSLGVMLYEVCTGQRPFRGETPAQALLKVIAEPAPPVGDLNPNLPAPLAALIGQLLEKDPERRPASAAEVAARLGDLETASGLATLPRYKSAATPRAWWLPPRRAWGALAALLVVLTAGFAALRLRQVSTPDRPVAVLVTEPSVAAAATDERSRLAAFAVREAILRALTSLAGIEAVGPDTLPENPLSLQEMVRAVAADEVVASVIDCQGLSCRVSLRRQRGGDARILGDSGPFDVSSEPEDALALTEAVANYLRKMFADHRPRGEDGPVQVQSADYERYLTLLRRRDGGEVLTGRDVDDLERLIESSPGLTEARVLAANTARTLQDRPRALRILREADTRDHDDPNLASERFLLELETGTVADAEAALGEFARRAPGDVRVLRARARLLIRKGQPREAVEVLRRLLRERPSWVNLWNIADVEIDLADASGAREHLEQLLEISPRNPRGRAKLAELEWFLGDPSRAARIYEELLKESETRENVSNLGWSLLLAGEYSAAAGAYRRALDLKPDHLLSRLNLGIAYAGLGDDDAARRAYQEVLERIVSREQKSALTVSERLLKAQALARLGQPVEAVELTMKALGEGERDSQVVFQAAIIFALSGDPNHAIVHAREARQRGLSPRWFTIPGFESLRATPAFKDLLAPR